MSVWRSHIHWSPNSEWCQSGYGRIHTGTKAVNLFPSRYEASTVAFMVLSPGSREAGSCRIGVVAIRGRFSTVVGENHSVRFRPYSTVKSIRIFQFLSFSITRGDNLSTWICFYQHESHSQEKLAAQHFDARSFSASLKRLQDVESPNFPEFSCQILPVRFGPNFLWSIRSMRFIDILLVISIHPFYGLQAIYFKSNIFFTNFIVRI